MNHLPSAIPKDISRGVLLRVPSTVTHNSFGYFFRILNIAQTKYMTISDFLVYQS
jgi:hypothetical protein